MRAFAELYLRLDQSNATNDKLEALADYLRAAPPEDAAWAIWFLSGRRLKRLLKRANLKRWALDASGYPDWVLAETYEAVGDLAETIALLLPEPSEPELETLSLARWVEDRLVPLGQMDEQTQAEQLLGWWRALPAVQRFVLNKLLTGALRVGVSQRLVTRALASVLEQEPALIAQRLMGDWQPSPGLLAYLASGEGGREDAALPYPFFLAAPLEAEPAELGELSGWQAEWKWDGIRAQLIRRHSEAVFWSRGEERLDGRFPELEAAVRALPDGTVLDGEILAFHGEPQAPRPASVLPELYDFAALQKRIGRKKPGPKTLAAQPAHFLVYDLLEWDGKDCRQRPLAERRALLERLFEGLELPLRLSPLVSAASWAALAEARESSRARGVEGLMLKAQQSAYGTGRQRGAWWKWKIDPLTVDAVLLYAQPGSGRRSNLLTDYTFGVWSGDRLVTLCKAYSGLTNAEISELDKWIRQHTTEKFGPVRAVEAAQVFEIAFEGIRPSSRHKAGFALRFPRIARWRRDLAVADADNLDTVQACLRHEN